MYSTIVKLWVSGITFKIEYNTECTDNLVVWLEIYVFDTLQFAITVLGG